MARTAKHPSALRTVREAVGEVLSEFSSQTKFGKLIGVAGPTVQALELGKLELSEPLALRVTMRTGVHLGDLKKNSEQPRDVWGTVYSAQSFRRVLSGGGQPLDPGAIDRALANIAALLRSASDNGQLELLLVLLYGNLLHLSRRFAADDTLTETMERAMVEAIAGVIAKGSDRQVTHP